MQRIFLLFCLVVLGACNVSSERTSSSTQAIHGGTLDAANANVVVKLSKWTLRGNGVLLSPLLVGP